MKLNHQKMYISLVITFLSIIAFAQSCVATQEESTFRTDGSLGSVYALDTAIRETGEENANPGVESQHGKVPLKDPALTKVRSLVDLAANSVANEGKIPVLRTTSHEEVPPLRLPQTPHLSNVVAESPDRLFQESMIAYSSAQHVPFLNPVEPPRKFAFITGITSGIGLELTKRLLRKGIHVLGVGRNEEALMKLKGENSREKAGKIGVGDLYTILADLSTNEGQDSVAPSVKSYLGMEKIDYVVFNAAVITPVGYEAIFNNSSDEIRKTINTNYTANVVLTGALCPYYRHQARLLYVSSIAGKRPGGGTLFYSTTKAAVDRLVGCLRRDRALRKEQPLPHDHGLLNNPWEELELNVAGVNPGNVNTPIHSRDLQGANSVVFPRTEFFRGMKDLLTPPETSAEFIDWLLTNATIDQYVENEEHNIYDSKQQSLWSPRSFTDPYASSPPIKAMSGQASSSPHSASPHAALPSPLSVSSGPSSPTVSGSDDLKNPKTASDVIKMDSQNVSTSTTGTDPVREK